MLTLAQKVELLDIFNQNANRVITVRNKTIVRMESPGPSSASPTGTTSFNAISMHGEAASADTDVAEEFVNKFKAIIEEGGYKSEQVFNMNETGLFWKRMPSRTFIMKDEAKAPVFKAQKDHVTVIMCLNAAGFMIKPGLIYNSKNPRALKYKNKNVLPVYWMHNPKKGLDFKVLLLMDNTGGHDADLSYDGVRIEYLPSKTTSLIQPMDQGIICAFKALYTRNALQHLIEAVDSDQDFSLKAYWREYTIASCLLNIERAIQEMKSENLNACWKKLWPEVVRDKGCSPDDLHHSAVDRAVQLLLFCLFVQISHNIVCIKRRMFSMKQNHRGTNSSLMALQKLRTRIRKEAILKTQEKRERKNRNKRRNMRKPNSRKAELTLKNNKSTRKITQAKNYILVKFVIKPFFETNT
uniref:DDE-1 domain-containing protein n=1 Tax=Poecilia mexicana TaxID=48701 RepID=A0A3B3WHD8_9TELE